MSRAFSYAKAKQEPALTEAGPVNEDAYWERITYFLKRVMPVADERWLVRLLLRHPSVELTVLTAERRAGQPMRAVFPPRTSHARIRAAHWDGAC